MVPLDICGIVLGIPYIYDRKKIFYREHNQYDLLNEIIEYIIHSHSFKNDKSWGTTQQLKRVVNASWNLTLMSMQFKEEKNPKHEKEVSLHHNAPIMVDSVSMVKHNHDMGTISFICSILIFIFLLFSSIWLVPTILNEFLV